MEPIRGLWRGLENCKKWLWRKVLKSNEEACRWGESHHMCYQQKTASLAWSYPTAWWSCPISYWGENNRKEATRKTSKGMLDRVRDGSPYVAVKRSRTIRKDLPAGRTHTCTPDWFIRCTSPYQHYTYVTYSCYIYIPHICHIYATCIWHICGMYVKCRYVHNYQYMWNI